jgi:F-type H+-transporting ATPase subunit epsilon
MKTFNLEILDPQKIIYIGKVTSVILPTDSGIIGVLADHMSLITNSVSGDISITIESGNKETIKSKKGVISILNNQVTVLL